MITNLNQLNQHQLKELEGLMAICKKSDGSIPNTYIHILSQVRTLPASSLYYEKEELIGFLSAYFFYEDAVEIALMVKPSERKRGIARQLIESIIPIIEYHEFQRLIFSSPSHLNDPWLLEKGFTYLHSEYYMEREELNPLLDTNKSLTFRKADMNDIPVLSAIDKACFPKHYVESVERFQHIIEGREYQIIIAIKNNKPIGKAHIRWQENGATLSDIAILPAYQGKGLGTSLITYCINQALIEGKPLLNLDVETHNLKALNLYSRLGFLIQNACDYWEINLKQLQKL
ncbi:GNAT family N-acetyltransferase [Legionella sp. km535]|uniref:GNAT family N-acetyltransferase n=1 Tax=Legionella sp. km535 TaxID=2498107 RepID=UPI000F8CC3F4|nr:GNAT family N-acetyltransferase [Legionella sp. km535]RUR20718.1 GNAT family N-acetyltransferase [Legionella sp. km535]